jgi:hypothetical protein
VSLGGSGKRPTYKQGLRRYQLQNRHPTEKLLLIALSISMRRGYAITPKQPGWKIARGCQTLQSKNIEEIIELISFSQLRVPIPVPVFPIVLFSLPFTDPAETQYSGSGAERSAQCIGTFASEDSAFKYSCDNLEGEDQGFLIFEMS